jgi:hypothetical protein
MASTLSVIATTVYVNRIVHLLDRALDWLRAER